MGLDSDDEDLEEKIKQERKAQADWATSSVADSENTWESQEDEEQPETVPVRFALDTVEEAEEDYEERQRIRAMLIQRAKVHLRRPDQDGNIATDTAQPDANQPPGEFGELDPAEDPFKLSEHTAERLMDRWGHQHIQDVFGRE